MHGSDSPHELSDHLGKLGSRLRAITRPYTGRGQVVRQVVAEHLGGERVDRSSRGSDGANDLFAAALLRERPFYGFDLAADAAHPRDELPFVPDGVHAFNIPPWVSSVNLQLGCMWYKRALAQVARKELRR
jgi:hypothetical protein